MEKQYQIAVAGTGYVGMSIAVLLAQHHPVFAVDIIPEKVQMIQNRQSPIQDTYIEQYLTQKELQLTATLDAEAAYRQADCRTEKRHTGCHRYTRSRDGSHEKKNHQGGNRTDDGSG